MFIHGLVAAGLVLLGASAAYAQAGGGGGGGRGGGMSMGGMSMGGMSMGGMGGSSGSSSSSATTTARSYINATMVGDALISSEMDTRRIIVVTDELTNESIKKVIAELDRPKPQVEINVVFLQVTHGNDLDLGAEASYTGKIAVKTGPTGTATSNFGLAAAAADDTIYGAFYSITGSKVDALIHALSTTNKTEILSRPHISTRSGQQATIMVGKSVPLITSSKVSDTTEATTNTVEYQDVGIILKVTPFVTPENAVELIVTPEISSIGSDSVAVSSTVSSPTIDKRSADTVVVAPNDRTVVIGGLMSDQLTETVNKIPLLGDIPVLGAAFKRTVSTKEKTELLIFLTPHVVQTPNDLPTLASEERSKLDMTPKTFKKQEVEKALGAK